MVHLKVLSKSTVGAAFSRGLTILADGNGRNRNKLLCSEVSLDFENHNSALPYKDLVKSTLKQYKFPIIKFSYDRKDVVEHAKSVGLCAGDPTKNHFINPNSHKLQVLPTFLLPLTNKILLDMAKISDFMHAPKTVHGEHFIQFPSKSPFPTEGVLNMEIKTLDVLDKGKGTLYCYNMNAYKENGEKVFHSEYQMYELGTGGFGGNKSNAGLTGIKDKRERSQECVRASFELETVPLKEKYEDNLSERDLRTCYYSSLHPRQYYSKYDFFPQAPICHGRYYFGVILQKIIISHMDGDADRVGSAKVRFSNPVFAGDTIFVDTWTDPKAERIEFDGTVTAGRNDEQQKVLKGGLIEMK